MKVLGYALIAIFISFLLACTDNKASSDGIIASVNGEKIDLKTLQTLLDIRATAPGLEAAASKEEMLKNYGEALNLLIIHALVRQELEQKNINLEKAVYLNEVNALENDLGVENLDDFLADAAIRKDEWIDLLMDQRALEIFKNKILAPDIQITLQEIRDYYHAHESDFQLPETMNICFLAADSRNSLEEWCKRFPEEKEKTELLNIQCVEATDEDLPKKWLEEVKNLKNGKCATIKQNEGLFQTIAKSGHNPARKIKISEAYPLIENLLSVEKRQLVFDEWLDQKLQSSHIFVSPHLKKYYSQKANAPSSAPIN